MSRRIFVGDVQGCRAELERLLEAVRFDPAQDQLQPVGDLVNRGPDSVGTLRLVRSVGGGGVLGNHDVHLLRVACGRRSLRPNDTFGDVLEAPDRDVLLQWLAERPFFRDLGGIWLVHAGLHPQWDEPRLLRLGPAEQDYAVNVRYCDAAGNRPAADWPPPGPPFQPWDDFYAGSKHVIFGHWARRGLVVRPQCVGLDTGCVYGGKLSAWIAEADCIVQVDGWKR